MRTYLDTSECIQQEDISRLRRGCSAKGRRTIEDVSVPYSPTGKMRNLSTVADVMLIFCVRPSRRCNDACWN